MSNKTQLQTNNTSLEALITRVNAAKDTAASLPEAGGGGGSLETCTVSIAVIGAYSLQAVVATTVENDSLSQYSFTDGGYNLRENVTIENVLCGSAICVNHGMAIPGWTISGEGLEVANSGQGYTILKAPAIAGTSAGITIYDML